ncbi:hypothetical protein L7F22_015597 [Adiantum nelumboides]|nr:hypothetical protein [Adiantum nelumboides]
MDIQRRLRASVPPSLYLSLSPRELWLDQRSLKMRVGSVSAHSGQGHSAQALSLGAHMLLAMVAFSASKRAMRNSIERRDGRCTREGMACSGRPWCHHLPAGWQEHEGVLGQPLAPTICTQGGKSTRACSGRP